MIFIMKMKETAGEGGHCQLFKGLVAELGCRGFGPGQVGFVIKM